MLDMEAAPAKTVQLAFSAPADTADQLLQTMQAKHYQIESQENSMKTVEELYSEHSLGSYDYADQAQDVVTKLASALSASGQWHVLVLDELYPVYGDDADWSRMKTHPNVDIVFLNKPDAVSKVTPPATEGSVRVHALQKTYRQGEDSLMAFKYLATHAGAVDDVSWAEGIVPDEEGRCPAGQASAWVRCKEGVKQLEVLETVQEMLENERKEMMPDDAKTTTDNVTVIYDAKEDAAAAEFCSANGWTYASTETIFGSESEVIL